MCTAPLVGKGTNMMKCEKGHEIKLMPIVGTVRKIVCWKCALGIK